MNVDRGLSLLCLSLLFSELYRRALWGGCTDTSWQPWSILRECSLFLHAVCGGGNAAHAELHWGLRCREQRWTVCRLIKSLCQTSLSLFY